MYLRYVTEDSESKEYVLGESTVSIGRGSDADIVIHDKMISRVHCGISFWDDAYFIRDFKSRNGTFVNDKLIEVTRLKPGDRIRVGDTLISFEPSARKGTETVLREVHDEMEQGKGYHTILQEIIKDDEK